jgi:hypothetical protein
MAWRPLTEPTDKLLVAGQESPGLVEISGAGSPRRWDIRKGYALQGARAVFRGLDVSRFRTRFRLIEAADWDAWHEFRPLVDRPPTGERPQALDVWHPILEDVGITQAVVENVGQAEKVGDSGEWAIAIAWIEYRRPAPLVVAADGAVAQRTDNTINQNIIRALRTVRDGNLNRLAAAEARVDAALQGGEE